MVASNQTLWDLKPVEPMCERKKCNGMTYGVGPAGIDLRIKEGITIPAMGFVLASCIERFQMPNNLLGVVHDKSTWARLGLCVQNTVIEPGWKGYLTIELTNHSRTWHTIQAGTPICQVVFHLLDKPTILPYKGKYQNQKAGIQEAILESDADWEARFNGPRPTKSSDHY
jgi:dCTP deaminase